VTPLTLDRLRELLEYDPATGDFRWLVNRGINNTKGRRAGTVNSRGYRVIEINEKAYREQRLAWFYVTGKWPEHEIDHRDRDRQNNRFSNLREATRSENTRNKVCKKSGRTGIRGVTQRENGKFRAIITVHQRRIHLGTYNTKEEAQAAYIFAAINLHGDFARVE
jgi:hypothetical protein